MGKIGTIRLVQVEYVQGGKADENKSIPADPLPWRYDPIRGGPSLVMGDIGTHAHNLIRFITGLEVVEVAAEVGNIVPGRLIHDYAGALLRFRKRSAGKFLGYPSRRRGRELSADPKSVEPMAVWSGCRSSLKF